MAKESKYSSSRLVLPNQNVYFLDGLINGLFGGAWSYGANESSIKAEKELAEQNLNYQRERNRIEDARYVDETDYNRYWSERDRMYNRALQQQVFEREDTALERQANQLSKLGINPLTQQMNGLEAGSVVPNAALPSMSEKSGQALHNDFKPTEAFKNMAGPLLEAINAIDNVNTGAIQRDSIRQQTNYQKLLNESQAIDNKYKEIELQEKIKNLKADTEDKMTTTEGKKTDNSRNKRVDDFQSRTGLNDMTVGNPYSMPNIAYAAENTHTALQKSENEFLKNPLTATGNKLKKSFGIVGNALANTFGKGAKKAFEYFNSNKKQYRTARSGRNW